MLNIGLVEIQIDMVVCDQPGKITEEELYDKFIKMIEENGWKCSGGIKDITEYE